MDALNDIRSDIDNIDSQLIRLLPNVKYFCGKGRAAEAKRR